MLHDDDLPPHQRHSDTSTEAAVLIAPKFGTLMAKLLETFKKRPYLGLTDEEGQVLLGMEGNTYRPCRVTLTARGWIEDSGQRRLTRSKRKAVVWMLKPPKTDHKEQTHGTNT